MTAADRTRGAILDAFLDLAHRENAVNISVPAVAQEAEVSVRTVYRYFPTKDDLQTAAAYRMSEQALRTVTTDQIGIDNVDTYLDELWGGFAQSMPAVIAEHATPAGRSLRRTRLPTARKLARDGLAAALRESNGHIDDDLVDLAVAVTSSSMFLELVDRMEHKPERAAALAARLVRILGEHAESNTEQGEQP